MKRWLGGVVVGLLAACATPGTPRPASVSAPVLVTSGNVTEADVDGVKVLIKRVPGAELVALRLDIQGGALNWDRESAGIEALAWATAVSSPDVQRRLDASGARLSSETGDAASALLAKCPREAWTDTFSLLRDVFLHPTLSPEDVERQRTRQLAALSDARENPRAHALELVRQSLFEGQPAELPPLGTEKTVRGLTRDALEAHLAKLRERHRLLLVVVGDVAPEDVLRQAHGFFARVEPGMPPGIAPPAPRFERPAVRLEARRLPTDQLLSGFLLPGWDAPDFAAALVAVTVLDERIFDELHMKRHLAYSAKALFDVTQARPWGHFAVPTREPGAVMAVLVAEARRLREETLSPESLRDSIARFNTLFLMANESLDSQAAMLSRAQRYAGDWRRARDLPVRLKEVTPEQVRAFANQYLRNLRTVLLGDTAKVEPSVLESL
ncbi:M16 family metallopeptidase [Melittangium boletus]|uniref:Zn-dependent peptidase n=1 Tax=Melittangium boletus DSM 14713 TaxID=1294270 RepID=A0A250ICX1_9BACT|nr:pitrilysin family protein [Melittangium boletus]ATB28796.1 Zn-dependent peptidase [Melittangium boletus DSM 14713]